MTGPANLLFDTHTHVVAEDQKRYPRKVAARPDWVRWLQDMPTSAEGLVQLMDASGVHRAALVQPYAVYQYDNSYIADSASRYPDRLVAVGIVDMDAPDAAARLAYWVRERGIRGVRLFTIMEPEAAWLDDPKTFPVWERAVELGIPLCVQIPFRQIPRLRRMVERFPQASVVLEGLAMGRLDEGPPYAGLRSLFDLARFPNLSLKFMTPNLYAARAGKGDARDLFRRLVDGFGAGRLMWGTNFPNTYDRPYPALVEYAHECLGFLSEGEQRQVFGENAQGLWPRP